MGYSIIVYNGFLPVLVKNLPAVREARGTPEYEQVEAESINTMSTTVIALVLLQVEQCLLRCRDLSSAMRRV